MQSKMTEYSSVKNDCSKSNLSADGIFKRDVQTKDNANLINNRNRTNRSAINAKIIRVITKSTDRIAGG